MGKPSLFKGVTKPQFSGHETFPLRQVWLRKFIDLLKQQKAEGKTDMPTTEEAIVELGVGKNMVSSMRFWAEAAGMVKPGVLELTDLGRFVFGSDSIGADEDCEHPATSWLVHWNLSSTPEHFTTNWFIFNHVTGPLTDREAVFRNLKEWVLSNNIRASELILKRSIEVCLRSYAPKLTIKAHVEDLIEPLLGELDLIAARGRDSFEFRRGNHPTLPDALFAYALIEYWERMPNRSATIDFNRIAYDIGSPGQVFKLDPRSVDARLTSLESLTDEALVWTEQAGLRQVIRRKDALSNVDTFKWRMLEKAYDL